MDKKDESRIAQKMFAISMYCYDLYGLEDFEFLKALRFLKVLREINHAALLGRYSVTVLVEDVDDVDSTHTQQLRDEGFVVVKENTVDEVTLVPHVSLIISWDHFGKL